MITVYGIRNCDTIRKTLRWLEDNDYRFEFHDYRKDGIDRELVEQFLTHFTPEQLINRRGTTWRGLPEATRENLSPATAAALMVEHPALIKRPVLTDGKNWLTGFDTDAIRQTMN